MPNDKEPPKDSLFPLRVMPRIDVSQLNRSLPAMPDLKWINDDRLRREAAVRQATLNVADATTELVKVAQAQREAIEALVTEAETAAATERRHFRITLAVAVIAMTAAIVAAIAAVLLIR